jgi:hypothetical protein
VRVKAVRWKCGMLMWQRLTTRLDTTMIRIRRAQQPVTGRGSTVKWNPPAGDSRISHGVVTDALQSSAAVMGTQCSDALS